MSETKMISEKEAVMRERAAYREGRSAAVHVSPCGISPHAACNFCDRDAAERYPLPKVTRPRVVTDSTGLGFRWFVIPNFPAAQDGRIQARFRVDGYWTANLPPATSERIRLWASVYSNPTEECDAEE